MSRKLELAGAVFGRLRVIEEAPEGRWGQSVWVCECDCGERILYTPSQIKAQRRCNRHRFVLKPEHRRLRAIWREMKRRCENPQVAAYRWYGARGIKVCERWQSFAAFVEDVWPRPSEKHSLDRIDSTGDYEPGNVRWATDTEQNRNREFTKLDAVAVAEIRRVYSPRARGRTLMALAKRFGVAEGTIHDVVSGRTWEDVDGIEPRTGGARHGGGR